MIGGNFPKVVAVVVELGVEEMRKGRRRLEWFLNHSPRRVNAFKPRSRLRRRVSLCVRDDNVLCKQTQCRSLPLKLNATLGPQFCAFHNKGRRAFVHIVFRRIMR